MIYCNGTSFIDHLQLRIIINIIGTIYQLTLLYLPWCLKVPSSITCLKIKIKHSMRFVEEKKFSLPMQT